MAIPSKTTSLDTLTRLLGEAFALHGKGASGARLGRAYGVADGYMLALMELGVATQRELGGVVAAARARMLAPTAAEAGSAEPELEPTLHTSGEHSAAASHAGTRAA